MDNLQSMEHNVGMLTFLGRASVKIKLLDGCIIYIDPYAGKQADYTEAADLILVTHQHGDHNQVEMVTKKADTVILQCPMDIAAGDSLEKHGIDITAVPAGNRNHPAGTVCGFILNLDGLILYHSGDTSALPEMADLNDMSIDYALLCMDGFYNMGAEEVAEVVQLIQPRFVVPIHTAKDGDYDQQNMDRLISDKKIVVRPGDTIPLWLTQAR